MTEAQVRAKVETWRAALAPQWAIDVEFGTSETNAILRGEEVAAATRLPAYSFLALIVFASDKLDRDDIEQTVVHEVLHLVLRPVRWAALDEDLRGHVSSSVLESYRYAEETLIDGFARTLLALV